MYARADANCDRRLDLAEIDSFSAAVRASATGRLAAGRGRTTFTCMEAVTLGADSLTPELASDFARCLV